MTERDRASLLDGGDEGFLSRWSRRKQQDAAGLPAEPHTPAGDVPVASRAEADIEAEPLLTDADMPPLHELGAGSDYSGFLSPGVSEELRQLALRKLFRAASFNVTDGLDDYDEDFTSFAKLGGIITREMRVRNAIDETREKAKAQLAGQQAKPPALDDDEAEADLDGTSDEYVGDDPDPPMEAITADGNTAEAPHSERTEQNPEEIDHEHHPRFT